MIEKKCFFCGVDCLKIDHTSIPRIRGTIVCIRCYHTYIKDELKVMNLYKKIKEATGFPEEI